MSYVVVQDMPASWEAYAPLASAMEVVPEGLILHVAGPTDEGIRTVDVWRTRGAWQRFCSGGVAPALSGLASTRTLRELVALNTIIGRQK